MKTVIWFAPDGTEFARTRCFQSAEHLWKTGRYSFVPVNGTRYSAGDWRGRQELEKAYGELMRVQAP